MASWLRKRTSHPKSPVPATPATLGESPEATSMAPPKRADARLGEGRNGDASSSHAPPGMEEPRFLALKRELHQEVISSIDLSVLAKMSQEQLRIEVRRLAEHIC